MEGAAIDFYNPDVPDEREALDHLIASGAAAHVVDALSDAVEEAFRLDFPFIAPGAPEYAPTFERYVKQFWRGGDLDACGVWAHVPWRRTVVHLPNADLYFRLRTARNRFLITPGEQTAFYDAKVGVAKLSVGLSVVMAIVLS